MSEPIPMADGSQKAAVLRCAEVCDTALESEPLLLILSAPSGGGKSTICEKLLAGDATLRYSISTTTRPPRSYEVDGVHFHFVDVAEFKKGIAEGAFAEWAVVHDNYYGTPRQFIERQIAQGSDVVLDLDVVGALKLKEAYPNAVTVFIVPPSVEDLKDRLRSRASESQEEMDQRFVHAKEEIRYIPRYDYLLINRDVQEVVSQIKAIRVAEKCRTGRAKSSCT